MCTCTISGEDEHQEKGKLMIGQVLEAKNLFDLLQAVVNGVTMLKELVGSCRDLAIRFREGAR